MKREIEDTIKQDLEKKYALVSGPRQVGKTTMAQNLFQEFDYLNYDSLKDRKRILVQEWNREKELIIFDELHKMKKWKQWLKGVYDTENGPSVIVTGSAKMETFRKVGDSMAGRYFHYNLWPLSLKELRFNGLKETKQNLEKLLTLSGFPEPFLSGSEKFYRKWRRTHLDIIIKQDLVEIESLKRIGDVATLTELMTERIGSPLSHNSLREDLQTDDKTIKRWLLALENSYVFFSITPYSKSMKYAIKKAPKYYFFDYPRVGNEGARLENFVALSIQKELLLRNDLEGENYSLHYLRDRQHREIDFLICKNKRPLMMVELKTSDDRPSEHFRVFAPELQKQNPGLAQVQLVKNLQREYSTKDGIKVADLGSWLERMPF